MIAQWFCCMSQVEANVFWQRWLRDYLPDITRRTKWFYEVKPIEFNDIVVIVDPELPRNCWPKGRIISVNTSKDGQVRSATVQTKTGIYERPATKLAVLDVRRDESVSQEPGLPPGDCYDPSVGASHDTETSSIMLVSCGKYDPSNRQGMGQSGTSITMTGSRRKQHH